jgi:hypothetical protein
MKINKKKCLEEIKRQGLNKYQFALSKGISHQLLDYLIYHGKSFRTAERLGKILNLNPKDLII